MKPVRAYQSLIAALALITWCSVTSAAAMTVQPVILDLEIGGRAMSQVVKVENSFDVPLPIEMRIESLFVDDSGIHGTGEDKGDLLVFPPQALIAPGQSQAFRVQYVGDPNLTTSRHYYVTAAQLPVKLPDSKSAIQILYNFQILVSVAPQGAKPDLKITQAEVGTDHDGKPVPILTVNNQASTYGYLSAGRLRIIESDSSGHEIFRVLLSAAQIEQSIGLGLVAAGQSRKILIPVVLPNQVGRVEAQFISETRR